MKQFLIRYSFKNGSEEQWHRDIAAFIAALDGDPELRGKIGYRCMKRVDGSDYYHLATPSDDDAVKALQATTYFGKYSELTKRVAGGEVEVIPLQTIAQTTS